MAKVGLLTCSALPEVDGDEQITLDALREEGLDARMVAWDAGMPPEDIDLFIIRSAWNYHLTYPAFLSWLPQCPRLLNPLSVVAENSHKSYLNRLSVPTVPTRFFQHGDSSARLSSGERVIKPAVSAGSWKTRVFEDGDPAGQAFLEELVAERDVMVQPFLDSVHGYGERSLIWINGEITHAIRKMPRFDDQDESVTTCAIAPDELAFAAQVMAGRNDILYARIDLMRGQDGEVLLSELELIEPSLFFAQHPPAAQAFAKAVAERLTR